MLAAKLCLHMNIQQLCTLLPSYVLVVNAAWVVHFFADRVGIAALMDKKGFGRPVLLLIGLSKTQLCSFLIWTDRTAQNKA